MFCQPQRVIGGHAVELMPTLLNEINSTMEQTAAGRGNTVTRAPRELPHPDLIGSPLHLKRLPMNLLSNAVKCSKENGSVLLFCREIRQEGETVWIEFICADAGIGMSEEFQKHLSEPFTQENNDARSAFGGMGLGMSIAKPLDPQTRIRALSKAIQDRTAKKSGKLRTQPSAELSCLGECVFCKRGFAGLRASCKCPRRPCRRRCTW